MSRESEEPLLGWAFRPILVRSAHCSSAKSSRPVQPLRYDTLATVSLGVRSGVTLLSPLWSDTIFTDSTVKGSSQYALNMVTMI